MIAHYHPIAIAIKGNADVGLVFDSFAADAFCVGAAAIVIYVDAVWLVVYNFHIRSQFTEHFVGNAVSGTMSTIY